ncbi:hypothetical protein [Sphingomonas glaciei]|uniref:Rap1a immunity protein domain-containing protein n=1 Tax=Sphingomonas glaciei TaxID=2938948 RepID=A0ABY5MZ65_9SPHN|nr:hypothetical protein [Sphingomonas glaciei]UUR07651.1 hypothetical protein M1K48_12050 [Sphingomonas glaciei]
MRPLSLALGAGLLTLAATPLAAQSMNAEVYHQRAAALFKKGPLALFSRGEIKALTDEGRKAGLKSREQRLAVLKAGGKPRSCPPEGQQGIGPEEFMKRLSAIPKSERQRIDMTEAMTRISAAKYPCPA